MLGPGCVGGSAWSLFVSCFCGCLCLASVGVCVLLLFGCRLSGRGPAFLGVVLSSASRRFSTFQRHQTGWPLMGGLPKNSPFKVFYSPFEGLYSHQQREYQGI